MRDREADVLRGLKALDTCDLTAGGGWARPLDIGGFSNSHHSTTLRRMIPKGWVEATETRGREGKRYRITEKGVTALQNHDASKALGKAAAEAAKAKLHERLGRA